MPARRFLLAPRLARIALRLLGGLGFARFLRSDLGLGLRRLLALEAQALSFLVPACIGMIVLADAATEQRINEASLAVQRDIMPAVFAARQRLDARPELMAILAPALQGMENDL